jgi:hypothetical protein
MAALQGKTALVTGASRGMGAALLAGQVRSIVGDRLDVGVLNAGISKAARIADYTGNEKLSKGPCGRAVNIGTEKR